MTAELAAQLLSLPEPLGAWDAKDRPPGWTDDHTRQMTEWVQAHLPVPACDIYRVEFRVLDGPFAVVYSYRLDGDGCKHLDPETGDIAIASPLLVPLSELPPAEILNP